MSKNKVEKEKNNTSYLGKDWLIASFATIFIAEIFLVIGVFFSLNSSYGIGQTVHVFFMEVKEIVTSESITIVGALGATYLWLISLTFLGKLFCSIRRKNFKAVTATLLNFISIANFSIAVGTMYSLSKNNPEGLHGFMEIDLIIIAVFALLAYFCTMVVLVINVVVDPIIKVLEQDDDDEKIEKLEQQITLLVKEVLSRENAVSEERIRAVVCDELKYYHPLPIYKENEENASQEREEEASLVDAENVENTYVEVSNETSVETEDNEVENEEVEDDKNETTEDLSSEDNEEVVITADGRRIFKSIPFSEKLEKLADPDKNKYLALRDYISNNYGLKSKVSKSGDSYSSNGRKVVFIRIAGKSLRVYFALNPEDYQNSSIPFRVEEKKKYQNLKVSLKVKSDLSLKRAFTLVDDVMKNN